MPAEGDPVGLAVEYLFFGAADRGCVVEVMGFFRTPLRWAGLRCPSRLQAWPFLPEGTAEKQEHIQRHTADAAFRNSAYGRICGTFVHRCAKARAAVCGNATALTTISMFKCSLEGL
jgi:hypothetical protein